jgi:hypothetical protein
MNAPLDLTELRRLLDGASMRNWAVRSGSSWEVRCPGLGQREDVVATFPYKGDPRAEDDARFVAAMRNALPGLLAEVERLRAAALFVPGEFVAHSGDTLRWKIECDALTGRDWEALALAAVEVLPPFGGVEGVPRGGLAFARALAEHSTPGGPLLIADDVCTTGASLDEHRAGRDAIGVVAFARGPVPDWVTPLLTLRAAAPASEDDEPHAFCVPATLWEETLSAARRYREGWTADLTAMKWWAPEHLSGATPAAMSLGERSAIEAIDAGCRAGSPPPTPAREQLVKVLASAYYDGQETGVFNAMADAVLALIAQPDREPLWRGTTEPIWSSSRMADRDDISTIPFPPGTAVRVDKDAP